MDVVDLCSQGFTSSGQLVLPSFLDVKGRFKMGTIGQILYPIILLLDLCFIGIGIKAHVAMIYAALQNYFPTGGFHLISIPFNLSTDNAIVDWPTVLGRCLKSISSSYQEVVIVVMNHTDEDTGDMFLDADETGKGHAAEVDQVCFVSCFSILLINWISSSMFCGHHSRTFSMVPSYTSLCVVHWSVTRIH